MLPACADMRGPHDHAAGERGDAVSYILFQPIIVGGAAMPMLPGYRHHWSVAVTLQPAFIFSAFQIVF